MTIIKKMGQNSGLLKQSTFFSATRGQHKYLQNNMQRHDQRKNQERETHKWSEAPAVTGITHLFRAVSPPGHPFDQSPSFSAGTLPPLLKSSDLLSIPCKVTQVIQSIPIASHLSSSFFMMYTSHKPSGPPVMKLSRLFSSLSLKTNWHCNSWITISVRDMQEFGSSLPESLKLWLADHHCPPSAWSVRVLLVLQLQILAQLRRGVSYYWKANN